MAGEYMQEQLSSLYDRIAGTVAADLESYQQTMDSTNIAPETPDSSVTPAAEEAMADFEGAMSLVDQVAIDNAKAQFSSPQAMARAISRNIGRKRQALRGIEQSKNMETPDTFEAQYFNPLTGQKETVTHQFSLNEADYETDILDDFSQKLFSDGEGFKKLVSDRAAFGANSDDNNARIQKNMEDFMLEQEARLSSGRKEILESEVNARRESARSFMQTFNEGELARLEQAKQAQGQLAAEASQDIRDSINQDQQDLSRLSQISGAGSKKLRISSDVETDRPL